MKTIIAVNGSPRTKWNTATLLRHALKGAGDAGAQVETIDLYKFDFKGCVSCFGCKRKGVTVETCVVKDELQPVLQRIAQADGLILGSPIYYGSVTGVMRCFLERLLFPHWGYYDKKPSSFPRAIPTAFIYTMNAPGFALELLGYRKSFKQNRKRLTYLTGVRSEILTSTETSQFDDYANYSASRFNAARITVRHENVFPEDCAKAYAIGKRMAESACNKNH